MLDATSQAIDTYLDEEDKAMSDLAEMADQQRKMDREEGAPDNAVDPVPQVEEAKPILIDAIYPALCAPFPTKSISWRVGRKSKDGKKAQVLAYIGHGPHCLLVVDYRQWRARDQGRRRRRLRY